MYNPATAPSNELNDFTRFFSMAKEGWPDRTEEYWVKLRNGTLARPVLKPAEDEYCEDAFFYTIGEQTYCWNLNGKSVTRPDYDMMELITL